MTGATGTGADYKFSVNPGYNAVGAAQTINDKEAVYLATRTPDRLKISIGSQAADPKNNAPTGAAIYLDVPPLISAQYYIPAGNGGEYKDKTNLPYFGVHQEPTGDSKGAISMDDRTLVLRDSGNYLVNFSVATNGTTGVPNLHVIVTDDTGTKDYNYMNFMPQGMTSGSMLLPIKGTGRVQFQIQGDNASIKVPTNPPMGELSVVKIA